MWLDPVATAPGSVPNTLFSVAQHNNSLQVSAAGYSFFFFFSPSGVRVGGPSPHPLPCTIIFFFPPPVSEFINFSLLFFFSFHPPPFKLKRHSRLNLERAWRYEVRAAKRRQEVIER